LVVNLAAQICHTAQSREVLIGDTLWRLVRKIDGVRFIDRGQSQIRGFAEPVRIVQVIREDVVTQEGATSA
jgi:class 3 adenylate cyclase